MSDWPSGLKKTKQREAVLNILWDADGPLSAQEINTRLMQDEPGVWLSTVYRTLDLLCERGIAVRTSIAGDESAYYELTRNEHRHYAVCVGCHKRVAVDNCPMTHFEPQLEDGDFRVVGHRIEMYGYCRDCDKLQHEKGTAP